MAMNKQTDRDISVSEMDRRNFIIRSGTGFAALGMVTLCPSRIVSADPLMTAFGFGSFIRGLFRFAKKIGMTALSITISHYLNKFDARIGREVGGTLSGMSDLGYGTEEGGAGQVFAGGSTLYTALVNPERIRNRQFSKAALVPFYDISPSAESRLGSALSTPTMSAMPSVADDLERRGHGPEEMQRLLIPMQARQNSYNMEHLPDTYLTRGGGVEANYRRYDEYSGDLHVRVTRKRPGKSERLEPVLEETYNLEFGE